MLIRIIQEGFLRRPPKTANPSRIARTRPGLVGENVPDVTLAGAPQNVLPAGIVPFPRGFASGEDGTLYLASGIGPGGEGENNIAVFDADGTPLASRFITDDAVSPLDLAIAPNGNIIVSSEFPFRARDAVTSIRVR